MSAFPRSEGLAGSGRSERFHRWRKLLDSITRRLISVGGISVIVAVVLILFYLVYVVFPLFLPATSEYESLGHNPAWQNTEPLYVGVEEQIEVGFSIGRNGRIGFFDIDGLAQIEMTQLEPPGGELQAVAEAIQDPGAVAVMDVSGNVLLLQHRYETSFADGVENRRVIPSIEYPYGAQWRALSNGQAARLLAYSEDDTRLVLASAGASSLFVELSSKQQNFLTGEFSLDSRSMQREIDPGITALAISGNGRWLYATNTDGQVLVYSLNDLTLLQTVKVSGEPITEASMLLGGISLLAGDSEGLVSQLFPVRDENNQTTLQLIRQFEGLGGAVRHIKPEYRRKGFAAVDEIGNLALFHTTAGQMVLNEALPAGTPAALAFAPRANGLISLYKGGEAALMRLENEHPEVSISSLWRKVWYENYSEPEFVWQSSAATNEFEPKFSLTPLAFGTLKAALFAMLFAVPLSLMGAAYTAYFMAPSLRELVKPTIEIMAALPTVILGFLAGLWFAPFIEDNLAAVVSMLLVLPVGLLLFAYWWSHYTGPFKSWVREGWEPALLLPVIVALVYLSLLLAEPLQVVFFGGDMRTWLSQEMGVSYDQRNALVVGFAMGFAVIPTIFSMAEDAVFGVPKSLSDGSLALGATTWQTLVRVILPTASPAIFSALMIGLGRAVGETMIVLMATGNTPVMDWSIFEGMRTLAANIAVEMPESEVDSSHYRILFLAALVLFLFTFVVNTGAEIIRQRLRERYSSL
ncbi:MAG: ABC transporter permease subunit [Xanthomonadales bacterium]|nr:ABC transporter permease subunit [Gammaproteobacteria bacterium]NNL94799.1 ABC transporter permease subunit [Xanthomonadales bacterium]